jgi:oxygen-independent coproporphyrinogen-3 oxidase
MREQNMGLYLHVPFCQRKCPYCDFNSHEGKEHLIPSYLDAMGWEIQLWPRALQEGIQSVIDTIYIGGGTPSLLTSKQVAGLLDICRSEMAVSGNVEISLEANPGTVTAQWLEEIRETGVNRISLGAQSFINDELGQLGRIHSSGDAKDAFRWSRDAGFDNISLDLIYGLPSQSLAAFQESLVEALTLKPEHMSLYALTIEENTPFGRACASGEMTPPDSDSAADMYLCAEEILQNAGYEHYEISNWCLPGRRCRHNLGYWLCSPYLGIGAGAHSYLFEHRFANGADLDDYIARLSSEAVATRHPPFGAAVSWWESIDPELAAAEAVILGLRLTEGVDLEKFDLRGASYRRIVQELEELRLVTCEGDILKLTQRGRLLGNEVFERFLLA